MFVISLSIFARALMGGDKQIIAFSTLQQPWLALESLRRWDPGPHQIAQRKVKRSEIFTFEPNLSINLILWLARLSSTKSSSKSHCCHQLLGPIHLPQLSIMAAVKRWNKTLLVPQRPSSVRRRQEKKLYNRRRSLDSFKFGAGRGY